MATDAATAETPDRGDNKRAAHKGTSQGPSRNREGRTVRKPRDRAEEPKTDASASLTCAGRNFRGKRYERSREAPPKPSGDRRAESGH
jgi:hypothetical protein